MASYTELVYIIVVSFTEHYDVRYDGHSGLVAGQFNSHIAAVSILIVAVYYLWPQLLCEVVQILFN